MRYHAIYIAGLLIPVNFAENRKKPANILVGFVPFNMFLVLVKTALLHCLGCFCCTAAALLLGCMGCYCHSAALLGLRWGGVKGSSSRSMLKVLLGILIHTLGFFSKNSLILMQHWLRQDPCAAAWLSCAYLARAKCAKYNIDVECYTILKVMCCLCESMWVLSRI